MDGISPGDNGCRYQCRYMQVGPARLGWSDAVGFVGQFYVQRFGIGLRINGHRQNAHLATGPDYPQCYLATIGNENFLNHLLFSP